MNLDYKKLESKWKEKWEETELYKVSEDTSRPKYYVLDMFPYPSGAGLHVGHPLGYVASDIFSRYKRMKGFNVLHPMGYDAFGLPAEQYALDTGVHPAKSTSDNIKRYRGQLDNIGLSFDWSRQVRTDDPAYYKWTQWIFLQLFRHFFDLAECKAKPITHLISLFENKGSEGVQAATSIHQPFSSSDWKSMTPAGKEAILMNYRLAYRKIGYVNWCEALGTVLANDEVKDGLSERGGFPVVQKEMMQWSLRITAYAERLLQGLDSIQFSDSLKSSQRNWIGKSEGALIDFAVVDKNDLCIKIFTTRPDTIFGCTFVVLAPDHDLVPSLTSPGQQGPVNELVEKSKVKSTEPRTAASKKAEGVWTGSYAFHPITGDKLEIWIADYVLKDYGTGAIMAVPGDDERDHAFATTYNLAIVEVIDRTGAVNSTMEDRQGKLMNSAFLNGLDVEPAIASILDYLEKHQLGKRKVEYKLRDANFSRQRYWGEPFPIYYDSDGLVHDMEDSELPHILPELDDFKPSPDGRSPLARLDSWARPSKDVSRETDTMPGYAGSSWYFLRYMDPDNNNAIASPGAIDYWRDVDLYVGGMEHAVGHLMYSRFWHKFLHDLGIVPTDEPYKKMVNQGMIQGIVESVLLLKERNNGKARFISSELAAARNIPDESVSKIPVHISFVTSYGMPTSHLEANGIDAFVKWRPEYVQAEFECFDGVFTYPNLKGAILYTQSEVGKMSKRYHNVVNPDDVIEKYGADCFRMYEMFLGPVEQSKPWDTMGIEGVSKFLKKFWSLFYNEQDEWIVTQDQPKETSLRALHATIKKVSDDVERFSFNTAISQFMICVNELRKSEERSIHILMPLVRAIAPFAPFISEELWQQLGNKESVHKAVFPDYEEKWLVQTSVLYPVCVNGKKRSELNLPVGSTPEVIESMAKELPEIIKWIEGKPVKKVIVIPDKMINIVI